MKHRMEWLIFPFLFIIFTKANPILLSNENRQADDYRLNNEIVPKNYKLELTIKHDFTDNRTFAGAVEILVGLKTGYQSSKKNIKVHMKDLIIDKVQETKLYPKNNSTNLLNKTSILDEKLEILTLRLKDEETLYKDTEYILRIAFSGRFQEDTTGFYLSTYKDEKNESTWLAVTNLQPTYARKVFPCFDEPNLKATYEIIVTHPKDYQIISNSRIIMTVDRPNDSIKTTFEKTQNIPTYTVAIILSKFATLSIFNKIVGINTVWARQKSILSANYAFEVTPMTVEEMNKITAVSFSQYSPKLDQIAIPHLLSESMANWGTATYQETAVLWNSIESATSNRQKIATNIAFELSYVWFGNLVTFEWWSSAWLSEGFACYFGYVVMSQIENDWQLENDFVIKQHQKALSYDVMSTIKPLSSNEDDVFTNQEILNKLGPLTYSKGSAIIRMMNHFIGMEPFIGGIQEYLQVNLWSNTNSDHLWAAISNHLNPLNVLPATLSNIMHTWTDQSGFPIVTVKVTGTNLDLSQKSYQLRNNIQEQNLHKWYIPVSYTTSNKRQFSETTPQLWMRPEDSINTIKDVVMHDTSWVIINIQSTAYIRVNYDDHLWKGLENALKMPSFDNIHLLNRVQIVDDAMNLARAGIMPYNMALNVTSYLDIETDYYPWYSAFNAFEYIRLQFYNDPEASELLATYLLQLMENFYKSALNVNNINNEVNAYRKELAFEWACKLDNQECVDSATDLYNSYVNLNKRIDPDLKRTVYCTVLRNSVNTDNWMFLRKKLSTLHSVVEIETVIIALGCTRNNQLLEQYLFESIDPDSDILKQDRKSVLEAVILGSSEGAPIALDFMKNNVDNIIKYYGGSQVLSNAILLLSDIFNQQKRVDEFRRFLYDNKEKLTIISHTVEVALEKCENNLYWIETYGEILKKYLWEKVYMHTTSTTSTNSTITTNKSSSTSTTVTVTDSFGDGGTGSIFMPSFILIIFKVIATIFI